jgi:hypothetical protein
VRTFPDTDEGKPWKWKQECPDAGGIDLKKAA